MNWITIYIKGRSGFRDEVKKKLENSGLNLLPGYIDHSLSRGAHDLYWVDEKTDLRSFKKTIGSKLIWKYRLRFYTNLEEFIQAEDSRKRKRVKQDMAFPPIADLMKHLLST